MLYVAYRLPRAFPHLERLRFSLRRVALLAVRVATLVSPHILPTRPSDSHLLVVVLTPVVAHVRPLFRALPS